LDSGSDIEISNDKAVKKFVRWIDHTKFCAIDPDVIEAAAELKAAAEEVEAAAEELEAEAEETIVQLQSTDDAPAEVEAEVEQPPSTTNQYGSYSLIGLATGGLIAFASYKHGISKTAK